MALGLLEQNKLYTMKISSSDFKRLSKQIILKNIGVNGQKKIFSAKVLVIGAGGLGCPLITYLASSGVGNIGVVDHDKVDLSNLSRQTLYTTNDIGKLKVVITKDKIKKINKKINVTIYKTRIEKHNIKKILKNYDIICDGTDNFKTRLLINDYCLRQKKILISAAIEKFDGQIFSFNFKKKNPCFRCFMPDVPEISNKCDAEGVMPTLAGLAGVLQANEVIKNILGIKSDITGKVLIFNSLSLNFRKVKLTKNSKCINRC